MLKSGLLMIAVAISATPASSADQHWSVERTASIVDQSVDYFAVAQAENDVSNIIDRPEKPALSVHCGSEGMMLTIHWPDFIEKPDFGSYRVGVVWSVDGAKPETVSWIAVDQAIALRGREARAMLHRLAGAKSFAIRVPDHHGLQEAAFELDGIAAIDAEIQTLHCG
jgi:hypothetical protein